MMDSVYIFFPNNASGFRYLHIPVDIYHFLTFAHQFITQCLLIVIIYSFLITEFHHFLYAYSHVTFLCYKLPLCKLSYLELLSFSWFL